MSATLTRTIRIMLIEDDPGDAGLVLAAMRGVATRANIDHVKTLAEAKGKLASHAYDVILADLSLPDSEGFPTITALQDAAPALPVIVLSGNDDFDFAVRAVQAGTQDFLVKGEVDGPAIHRSILYAIQRKQLEEELRKARDDAEASTRAKAHFLAVMSHEIRTPMNGILGLSYLLLEDTLSPRQRDQVQLIQESASGLLTVLNDILDFSKLEADRMEVLEAPFEVRRVIADIVALLRARAREKGIRLDWEVAPEVPRLIVGDGGRLRQLLLNLIGNAVKFTITGGVTARILMRKSEPRPGALPLRFEVRDTGIGIEPKVRTTLFTPFTQGDVGVARRFGGTGLGLAICRKILERLGGEIGVDSEPGQGSLFWFHLDFQRASPEAGVVRSGDGPAPLFEPAPLRVLVADDNTINQIVARSFLENAGHTVTVVADGVDAIRAVRSTAFDVVLMDVQMPRMDGLDATRAIRALPRPLSLIPIIALTAGAMPEEVERCREAGMTDHLPKPVDPAALAAMLAKWCQRSIDLTTADDNDDSDDTDGAPPVLDEVKAREMIRATGRADFEVLLKSLPAHFEELYRSLLQADAESCEARARRLAHDLKGMLSNLRLTRAAETLATLEAHYREARPGPARALLPLIPEQFAAGLAALRRCLD